MRIDKDAFVFFIPVMIVSAVLCFFYIPVAIVGLVLAGYILFFFREPHRVPPTGEKVILSAADGKVVGIDQVIENDFFEEKVTRISIFLSIFDVHINYSPIAGKVLKTQHTKGKFHAANANKSALLNENNIIGVCNEAGGRIMVKQIAGLIARRIVCRCAPGDKMFAGQQIGLIRFGSRVEVYVPLSTKISVKVGDRVKGRLTVLGELK
ncbi:MAG: phosphatidylserine decarboxylase family protein [Candidatus Auribacterota bacterium]